MTTKKKRKKNNHRPHLWERAWPAAADSCPSTSVSGYPTFPEGEIHKFYSNCLNYFTSLNVHALVWFRFRITWRTGVVKMMWESWISKKSSISVSPVSSLQLRPTGPNFFCQFSKHWLHSALMGATGKSQKDQNSREMHVRWHIDAYSTVFIWYFSTI